MKRFLISLLLLAFIFGIVGPVMAANTATQVVTYEVQAINEISVSGNPGALIVSTATAGQQPNEVLDNSTTYNITTNETNKTITGALAVAMPAGVTLKINLVAPTGATSVGDVTLTTTAQNLVTGITKVAEGGKVITYKLSATVSAGVITSSTNTVTLTLQ